MVIRAQACANIALTKYWGKSDLELNLPAVPSLSLTLDALRTETSIRFIEGAEDRIELNGEEARGSARARMVAQLDRLRSLAKIDRRVAVASTNHFPTAAGLASSASGFAALTFAADALFDLGLSRNELSAIARRASASAARSLFGGFSELPAGRPGEAALGARAIEPQKPQKPQEPWDLTMIIAIVSARPKSISSTEGMERTRKSSKLYPAWVEAAPEYHEAALRALEARDLSALGHAMERSTFAFHASAMAADPPLIYLAPATLSLIEAVRTLREDALPPAYMTMDAGPNLKLLMETRHVERWARELRDREEIEQLLISGPGEGAKLLG